MSGYLDWGKEVSAFESEFAKWIRSSYAIGVSFGTAALKISMLALDIDTGHEVITVAYSDASSTEAIILTGETTVLIDIEKDVGGNKRLDALKSAL